MISKQKQASRTGHFLNALFPSEVVLPILLLFASRLVSILTLPLQGFLGYGDFQNFVQLARLPGWPFIHYWVEFPPIFPFLNALLYRLASGNEVTYYYLLAFVLLAVDLCNLVLFIKIVKRIHGTDKGGWRVLTYLIILVAVPYTWWYFDSLTVFGILLALLFLLDGRDVLAGSAIAFGALVKLFPLLILVIPWRYYSKRRALKITIVSLAITGAIYGGLYLASPTFTKASIRSQVSKGSWETVWALIDGNYQTGNFGPYSQRLQPEMASVFTRNPPVINPLWSLFVFGGAGFWIFLRRKIQGQIQMISFLGLAFCFLFLWSPGWSPQWVLLLLPVLLLSLPQKEGLLLAFTLILVNLLEWPVLLSRGLFNDLWVTVVLRTLVLALAGLIWYQESNIETLAAPDQTSP